MRNNEKHLWEVKHSYYCNEGNYYNNDCGYEYKSWADFMEEMGESDEDYNLLFRWDWDERDDEGEPTFNGDVNYRNGLLKLFYMQQRKGRYTYCLVAVCRADEVLVRAFLEQKWSHMRSLWEPLAV